MIFIAELAAVARPFLKSPDSRYQALLCRLLHMHTVCNQPAVFNVCLLY